jgi:hypothetical protein
MKPFALLAAVVLGLAFVASSAQACERESQCQNPAPGTVTENQVNR